MASFAELCEKRSILNLKISAIDNYLNNKSVHEKTEELINKQEEELDKIYEEYFDIKIQLEHFVTKDNEKKFKEKNSEFENQFWKIKCALGDCRENLRDSRNSDLETDDGHDEIIDSLIQVLLKIQAGPDTRVRFKLPEPKLPSFSGKLEEWGTFIDTFDSIIHQEKQYSNIDKFHFLNSCLSDDLRCELLSRFKIRHEGYELALQYLNNKYSTKRDVINKHLSEILEVKVMEEENSKELRTLIDCFSTNLDQANAINPNANWFDLLIVFMVSTKLDEATRRAWEIHIRNEDDPTWGDMREFLVERCIVLERLQLKKSKPTTNCSHSRPQSPSTSLVCCVCKKNHRISHCPDFQSLSVSDRLEKVKKLKLCFNCLSSKHYKSKCTSQIRCHECAKLGHDDRMHHTMIHFPKFRQLDEEPKPQNEEDEPQRPMNPTPSSSHMQNVVRNHCCGHQKHVFLLTAIVEIRGAAGNYVPCHAILDTGSQCNFITKRMANILNLKKKRISLSANGLNGKSIDVRHSVELNIRSRTSSFSKHTESLILSEITGKIPENEVNMCQIKIINNLELADPTFGKPKNIDVLIGGDITMDAILGGKIQLSNRLHLRESKFGWLVSGSTKKNDLEEMCYPIQCLVSTQECGDNPAVN